MPCSGDIAAHTFPACELRWFRAIGFACAAGRGNVTLAGVDIVEPIVTASVCAAVVVAGLRWSRRGGRQVDFAAAIGAAVVGSIGIAVLVNIFQPMAGFVVLCLSLAGLIALGILYVVVPGWLRRPVRSGIKRRVRRNSSMLD